ncbi:MAG: UDP-N-acetylmuramate dehydrogenase [Candidatus Levyibacteriota bacterium]
MIIQKNVPLKDYSNYKIGGPARYFLKVSDVKQLKEGLLEWRKINKDNKPAFVLGSGTKILINDDGYDGLVIYNSISGIEKNGELLRVGAGVLASDLLKYCLDNSLIGFEWAGGLPGTIGGAVRGNAGAFGGETKDNLIKVKSININSLEEKTRENIDCIFGYRDSIFKSGEAKNEIITDATFLFKKGDKNEIARIIEEKINHRKKGHPLEYPSIGSTFKNVPIEKIPGKLRKEFGGKIKYNPIPVLSAARFINLAGLKGERIGNAQFSEKNPNFIVNLGNAKEKDVKALINLAKAKVKENFNVDLEEEIIYL